MAFIEATQGIGEMFNQLMGQVPPGAQLLHQGQAAAFYHEDLAARLEKNPLARFAGLLGGGGPGGEAEWPLEQVDSGMAELGFSPLGDLVCDKFLDIPMRGYAAADGDTYGTLVANGVGESFPEFCTRFEDGSSLITSVRVADAAPERGLYRLHLPGGDLHQLYEKHRRGIARMQRDGATPAAARPVLEGLAEAIDAFLQRRLG